MVADDDSAAADEQHQAGVRLRGFQAGAAADDDGAARRDAVEAGRGGPRGRRGGARADVARGSSRG